MFFVAVRRFPLLDRRLPDRELLKALGYVFRPKGSKTERKRPSSLLSLQEAADYLGRHHDTLRKMIANTRRLNRKGLPDPEGIRFHQAKRKGAVLFERADLDDWLARTSVDPAVPPKVSTKPARRRQRANQSHIIERKRFWT
jgi:Helix-turn-helix domain